MASLNNVSLFSAFMASDAALLVGGKTKGTDTCGLRQASILESLRLFTFFPPTDTNPAGANPLSRQLPLPESQAVPHAEQAQPVFPTVGRPQALVRVSSLPAIQADMDQLMARFTPEERRLITRLDCYRREYVALALDEFVDAEPACQQNAGNAAQEITGYN